MNEDTKVFFFGALATFGVLALMLAGVLWVQSAQCSSRWERSGLQSEFRVFGGCIVHRKDGTWVPAAAIRDMAQ